MFNLIPHLPSACEICRAWPSQALCCGCISRFAAPVPRCSRCALQLTVAAKPAFGPLAQVCTACQHTPTPLDACIAAVDYVYPWPELIARFKFRHSTGLAGSFAQLMAAAPWSGPLLDVAQLIVPMPLSRERLRQRGYNQSLLLAKKLGFAGLQARLCKNLLVRRLDTQPQSNLSRADRARNVQHAFEVPPEQTVHVRGQQVVLIDDVMTSGATLYAAALALRLAGAAQVSALVFARTRHGID